jgi:hypothetical protein
MENGLVFGKLHDLAEYHNYELVKAGQVRQTKQVLQDSHVLRICED